MKPTQTLAAIRCTGVLATAHALSGVILDGSCMAGASWSEFIAGAVEAKGGGDRRN